MNGWRLLFSVSCGVLGACLIAKFEDKLHVLGWIESQRMRVKDWWLQQLVEAERRRIVKAIVGFRETIVFDCMMEGLSYSQPFGPWLRLGIERGWTEENIYKLAQMRVDRRRSEKGEDSPQRTDSDYKKELNNIYAGIFSKQYSDQLSHLQGVFQANVRAKDYVFDHDRDVRQHILALEDNEVRMLRLLSDAESAYQSLGSPPLTTCREDPTPSELIACFFAGWPSGWKLDQIRLSLWELCVEGYVERDEWRKRLDGRDISQLRSLLSPAGMDVIEKLGGGRVAVCTPPSPKNTQAEPRLVEATTGT